MKRSFTLLAPVLAALCLTVCVRAQDSFKDVPAGNWAYKTVTDLQTSNILIGYPEGYFNGKRVLTRYEFALALKRAFDSLLSTGSLLSIPPVSGTAINAASGNTAPGPTRTQLTSLQRLVEEFSKDLAGLHVDTAPVKSRLENMVRRTGSTPDRSIANNSLHLLPVQAPQIGLIGSQGAANTGQTGGHPGDSLPIIAGSTSGLTAPGINPATAPVSKSSGLHISAPLFNVGTVGGTIIDFASLYGAARPGADVIVSGVNFNLNPIGRVNLSGAAARSGSPFDASAPGVETDTSAFNLNVRYNAGPVDVLGGFQYIDPGYEAPSDWTRISLLPSPTNVQGPFIRVNYNVNNRTQVQFGSDLFAGARNRSYNFGSGITTGFGTHDYMGTLSAGMQYKLWHFTSLMADWEGRYWDLSSGSTGNGTEAHPFESYINLGTGINIRGSAMLKLGYEIGTFGNFGGLGAGVSSGSGQSYNAFTTQLSVKF